MGVQSPANGCRVCGSKCKTPGKLHREKAVVKGEKSRALHLAPGDDPDRLVNAKSIFIPKAKQLGNTTQKVPHSMWDFTRLGPTQLQVPKVAVPRLEGSRCDWG